MTQQQLTPKQYANSKDILLMYDIQYLQEWQHTEPRSQNADCPTYSYIITFHVFIHQKQKTLKKPGHSIEKEMK